MHKGVRVVFLLVYAPARCAQPCASSKRSCVLQWPWSRLRSPVYPQRYIFIESFETYSQGPTDLAWWNYSSSLRGILSTQFAMGAGGRRPPRKPDANAETPFSMKFWFEGSAIGVTAPGGRVAIVAEWPGLPRNLDRTFLRIPNLNPRIDPPHSAFGEL